MVFLDFALRFTQGGFGGESLRHRLSLHLASQPIVGTVAWIVGGPNRTVVPLAQAW